ncbi:MAG: hypothetical protein ACREV1_18560, partial [Gammaproteobacteria bacterium]
GLAEDNSLRFEVRPLAGAATRGAFAADLQQRDHLWIPIRIPAPINPLVCTPLRRHNAGYAKA